MNSSKGFDTLPNELLIQILSYAGALDNQPPTALSYRDSIKRLDFVPTLEHPWRILAQVSKRWKEIALPLLVENSCLSIFRSRKRARISRALMLQLKDRPEGIVPGIITYDDRAQKTTGGYLENDLIELDTLQPPLRIEKQLAWIIFLHHEVEAFLHFVVRHGLQAYVKGLTIHSCFYVHPYIFLRGRHLKKHVQLMWQRIFKVIKPTRLILCAMPGQMTDLTSSSIRTSDAWAFSMLYHFLEFCLETDKETDSETWAREKLEERLENDLLDLHERRPWTHMTYNEGTMIRGYSHYEWQEKIPPQILPNLLKNIVSTQHFSETPRIRSCRYISYFPYSEHVKTVMKHLSMLKSLKNIEVGLADADMISDPLMLGKGQSADCWQEWELSYKAIIKELLNNAGAGLIFESRDQQTTSLKNNVIAEMEFFAPCMRREGVHLRWVKAETATSPAS